MIVNWLVCLLCSATFFLHSKVWAVYRADPSDLWSLAAMTAVLGAGARVSCFPAERALAIYLCLLPARLLLIWKVKQMAIVEANAMPADSVIHRQTEQVATPVVLQANLGLAMLVKVMASRLMRTFYASHYQAFTPARVRMLARDPILSFFDCIDAVCAAYLRYCRDRQAPANLSRGVDEGLAAAMPVCSMALLLIRYSDWFALGGGRYVGDLPFWLIIASVVLVEWRDLVVAVGRVRGEGGGGRRLSSGPTSLSDFLAKSKIPDNLHCNPVLLVS